MSKKAAKPSATEKALRKEIIATARAASQSGLTPGRSGNVSARFGDGMLITPTGMTYNDLEPGDIVHVLGDGSVMGGQRKPSSEWHFHLAAYAVRPDRYALVHTHSMHATVLACAHKSIPAFHYMVAVAGGSDIPCVPYATFGTDELARHVANGLKTHDACLMANHGQVALGETLKSALELAFEVETLAEQYFKVLQLGNPYVLPDDEMNLMLEKFKTYGQKAQD
jgi:L-fuculose-phosphate aldolase